LAVTLYYLGDFETAREYAVRAIEIWRSGSVLSQTEDLDAPVVTCLVYEALCAWHLGEITTSKPNMVEAISLSKKLNDMHGLASTLFHTASIGHLERNPVEVESFASEVIELATRHHFAHWSALGSILRGWARSASAGTVEGVSWIEDGIRNYRAIGAMVSLPYLLGIKAEALHLADRTFEGLEAIREAEAVVARSGARMWCAELHRLKGVFLAAIGGDESQIEDSFCEAICIAKQQKSVSLEKRAEATYAEYRRQKASESGVRGFRLPLC
jgi:adenylate cyclase